MPIACRFKLTRGKQHCVASCPVVEPESPVRLLRVENPSDVPVPDERMVDVPVLDMNHGWQNLGHDSLVHAVQDAVCDLLPDLREAGLGVRILSYDVRRSGMVPEPPPRFTLYLGTGGPGHLDPHRNDGQAEGSQGLHEDPSWEPALFALFDAIVARPPAALLGVCHTFGVMCRWSGAAEAVLRPASKGGKSVGILENVLTPEAQDHPWFARFADELRDGRHLPVVDHRLFDLLPAGAPPSGAVAIGHEALGGDGPPGEALTMMEFARDEGGVVPRVFGVNHHPEIVDRSRQLMILRQKHERGEVSQEWYEERARLLMTYPDDTTDQRLHLTSDYTLLGPLRFHLYREVRRRAQALGRRLDLDDEVGLPAAPQAQA